MAAIVRVSRVFNAPTGAHAALAMRAVSSSVASYAPVAACGLHAASACAGVHASGSALSIRVAAPVASTTRAFHTSRAAASAKNPGPVEQKFRKEFGNYKSSADIDASMVAPLPAGKKAYSLKVQRLAQELTNLTLLETVELNDLLKQALGLSSTDLLFSGFAPAGGAAPAAAPAAAAAPVAKEAPKEEKTHFDIKLKKFDAKDKIKVIKEVRGVTNLGLKEAKELVESAPCTILTKVKKEDAAKIIETLKTATGAELELV